MGLWLQERATSAGQPAGLRSVVTAPVAKLCANQPKDTTVSAGTVADRHSSDGPPFRCVTAKSLISNADGAMTQMTQDSGPILRGNSRARGAAVVPTARRRLRPHRAVAVVSCGRSNPLIRNGFDRTTAPTARKGGSFHFSARGRRSRLSRVSAHALGARHSDGAHGMCNHQEERHRSGALPANDTLFHQGWRL